MSLLPTNSTKLEKDAESVIVNHIDADILSGFKFKGGDATINLALIWEYSLANINIEDMALRIAGGIAFHRINGTPSALRQALSWYDFNHIKIEEETTGEHFAEFQIGLSEIPNGFEVDRIISTATFASPLRSRLSRMYNDKYDVRRLILSESDFGAFLSDYSGVRLNDGGPKLSFGRENHYEINAPITGMQSMCERVTYDFAKNDDTFKLDFAFLDDAPIDIVNRGGTSHPHTHIYNAQGVGPLADDLFDSITIARALVVLSDSVLEDINAALSGGYDQLNEAPFMLSFNALSQQRNTRTRVLIEERFFREKTKQAEHSGDYETTDIGRICGYVIAFAHVYEVSKTHTAQRYTTAEYPGNNVWHDHRHFDVAWSEQKDFSTVIH